MWGMGTSSRNSGVLHSGIHYTPGTLRARLNVQGNEMMKGLCRDLKVKIDYIGKLTVAQDAADIETLESLKAQGEANGVPGLEIIDRDQMERIQPGVGGIRALHSPTTGIICPYGLTIALADNAHENGVRFHLAAKVTGIKKTGTGFNVKTDEGGSFESKLLINAAGLYSDAVCKMLGLTEYAIYPCRGEYLILDKRPKRQPQGTGLSRAQKGRSGPGHPFNQHGGRQYPHRAQQ